MKATDQMIADTFVRLLRAELTPEDFAEMRRRNATAEYRDTGCCASHDFTDANMVLADAFEEFGIDAVQTEIDDQGFTARWNRVWALAMPQLTGETEK